MMVRRNRHPLVAPGLSPSEEGSALIEAVFIIACLFIPLMWMAVALLHAEAASYATRTAAREAARTFVTSATSAEAPGRAELAARMVYEDARVPRGDTRFTCTQTPCLTPGATVSATTQVREPLPFIPHFLSGALHLEVVAHSTHTENVEKYGGVR